MMQLRVNQALCFPVGGSSCRSNTQQVVQDSVSQSVSKSVSC